MSPSAQVKLDYEQLHELEQHLTNALDVLAMDIESSGTIAAASGDARLGAHIVDFNRAWNKHRYDIKDQLEWLRDSVKNIAEQFAETDRTLATGITGSGSASGTASTGSGSGARHGGRQAV